MDIYEVAYIIQESCHTETCFPYPSCTLAILSSFYKLAIQLIFNSLLQYTS